MSLMTNIHVGASGLKASQYALNTTAHNLANVETEGYVRQQTVLTSSHYQKIGENHVSKIQVGFGVDTDQVRQVRNFFLDQSYRKEAGRQGFYDSQKEAVTEIENLFGELQGVAFQDSLEDFWVSIQELSKQSDSLVAQASLVETAVTFVERADAVYRQLFRYQLDLNVQLSDQVNRINKIGEQIIDLNQRILKTEAADIENANDYRDQRNKLLDELSQMVKITYKEQVDGKVRVDIEGIPFVTDNNLFRMGTMTVEQIKEASGEEVKLDETAGLLVPIWPGLNNMEVYNMDILPNMEADTDIGALKGMLLARGLRVGKHTDIPREPKQEQYIDDSGVLDEEAYEEALVNYTKAVEVYNKTIEPSILMSTQAQFDQLINGIVTTVNNILCPLKEVLVSAGESVEMPDGEYYTFEEDTILYVLDEENAPVGTDEESTMGEELFSRKSTNRYLERQSISLADGSFLEDVLIYQWEDPKNNYSMYTLGEIQVNPRILENKSRLPVVTNNETKDYDLEMVERLITAWQEPFATISPNTLTYSNFNNYYTMFIGGIATKGDSLGTISESQESMVNSVNDKRTSITGVAADEELTNLIKYQHAYNAAARYINVVSEMLEHIVTRI